MGIILWRTAKAANSVVNVYSTIQLMALEDFMTIPLQGSFTDVAKDKIRKSFFLDRQLIYMSLIPNKKTTKCYISECKQKAKFVIDQNGKPIQLCKLHYEIHQNKDKRYKVGFSKASSIK